MTREYERKALFVQEQVASIRAGVKMVKPKIVSSGDQGVGGGGKDAGAETGSAGDQDADASVPTGAEVGNAETDSVMPRMHGTTGSHYEPAKVPVSPQKAIFDILD